MLHPGPHLHGDRQLARRHGKGPATKNPADAAPRLGHPGHTEQDGDSWFTGEEAGHLDHPAGDRRRRHHDLLHVRHPPLDARVDQVLPRRDQLAHGWTVPDSPRLGRRAFLGALGGGALASRCRWGLRPAALLPRRQPARALAGARPSGHAADPAGAERRPFEIPIREAEVQIFPGAKTRMWTYGGTFPGPTIRRPAGQRTEVTFRHGCRGRRAS